MNELMKKLGDGDFLGGPAETLSQLVMEIDVESLIGPLRLERNDERQTQNRHMQVEGMAELSIPAPLQCRANHHSTPGQLPQGDLCRDVKVGP
ncbi:hypothetical protein [Paramagnetospirillum kuznetsovii]|uniref:hypothetical protein n=1 Tax=Paramagnetospirillum kuznetsovii TaxID=2053833 RepID=UPI0011BD62D2|nr:hypothetical protein [Paramagnetospirillum kuznetsovii]